MMNPNQMMNQSNLMMNPNQMMLNQQQNMNMMAQQLLLQKMQQQMLLEKQNNNNNLQNTDNLNIIFKVTGKGQNALPINIPINSNEKVSTLIEKYRSKTGDLENTKVFIFNAKELRPNLTCKNSGLYNNSTVFVINKKGVKGA